MTSVQLTTSDGHNLAADIAEPTGTADSADTLGGVVLCHPHPSYGGNRFNTVVEALFRSLPAAGFVTLRFDFRAEHDGGANERLDVIAALDALDARTDRPLAVVGYSFGAAVALDTVDERIASVVAIAPPLSMMPAPAPDAPTLVLTPRHDQFCPPDEAEAIVGDWPNAEFGVVESADHFLAGHTAAVADRVVTWLRERRSG